MEKEIKDRWVKALRSGEYRQGIGCLKRINPHTNQLEYCCLGVLAEEVGEDFQPYPGRPGVFALADEKGVLFSSTYPPGAEVLKLFEAPGGGWHEQRSVLSKFIEMNDGVPPMPLQEGVESRTFLEIADWIEENL